MSTEPTITRDELRQLLHALADDNGNPALLSMLIETAECWLETERQNAPRLSGNGPRIDLDPSQRPI